MVVAEGIKDFHEQMEILLDKKVTVDEIGPELLSINRESLNLSLNLSQINKMTAEEQKEIENRISEKISNLTSPGARITPKSNRTITLRSSNSLEKLTPM